MILSGTVYLLMAARMFRLMLVVKSWVTRKKAYTQARNRFCSTKYTIIVKQPRVARVNFSVFETAASQDKGVHASTQDNQSFQMYLLHESTGMPI